MARAASHTLGEVYMSPGNLPPLGLPAQQAFGVAHGEELALDVAARLEGVRPRLPESQRRQEKLPRVLRPGGVDAVGHVGRAGRGPVLVIAGEHEAEGKDRGPGELL